MKLFLGVLICLFSLNLLAQTKDLKLNNALIVGQLDKSDDRYLIEVALTEVLAANGIKAMPSMNILKVGNDPQILASDSIKDLLSKQCRKVLTHDPYVKNDLDLVTLQVILENADILLIGAPHNIYKTVLTSKPIIDVWNLLKRGSSI